MAGHVTVRVELNDGTVVEKSRHWAEVDRNQDGAEAQDAAKIAADEARAMIDAKQGDTSTIPASWLQSHPGRG